MTTSEFSQSFDAGIQAYFNTTDIPMTSRISFDEYEKSVFLTKAQDAIVVSYYNGKNSAGNGFEVDEESRRYLANLVVTVPLYETNVPYNVKRISDRSHFFCLPQDLMFIVYEAVELGHVGNSCLDGSTMEVVPVTHDEYHRTSRNPFKMASDTRALRLDIESNLVEIICKYNIDCYLVRYLRRPDPIIVDNLANDVDIHGRNKISECELPESLHHTILDLAINLAIASKSYSSKK